MKNEKMPQKLQQLSCLTQMYQTATKPHLAPRNPWTFGELSIA